MILKKLSKCCYRAIKVGYEEAALKTFKCKDAPTLFLLQVECKDPEKLTDALLRWWATRFYILYKEQRAYVNFRIK